jgi:hypothetical protein
MTGGSAFHVSFEKFSKCCFVAFALEKFHNALEIFLCFAEG